MSAFAHRWCDLTAYKLLILHTYSQFGGKVWLGYDQAFREHAATTKLTDWSCMNVHMNHIKSSLHSNSSSIPIRRRLHMSLMVCGMGLDLGFSPQTNSNQLNATSPWLTSMQGSPKGEGIDPEKFPMQYIRFDEIICMIAKHGHGATMAQFDAA